MLELRNIYWSTPSGHEVLHDISLSIDGSGIVVITGPNGGGKTTIAKIIAGIEKPDSGSILFNGEDITDLGVTERARKGISYAFQQPVRFKGLTVRDLLDMASGRKLDEKEICSLLSKVGLCAKDYVERDVDASLSGGEIKRIEIATVFARKTRFSVFDEPEAGIDLWSFPRLIGAFEDLRKDSGGIEVIISHQERILDIADRVIVIENGRVKEDGKRNILDSLLRSASCPACPKRS